MNIDFKKELDYINSPKFKLGEFIYMGMGKIKNKTVCISVAYKIDYCVKKAKEFEHLDENVKFTHINKVKVGELKSTKKFIINE